MSALREETGVSDILPASTQAPVEPPRRRRLVASVADSYGRGSLLWGIVMTLAVVACGATAAAGDGPLIATAEVRVIFLAPTHCQVTLRYRVDGAGTAPIDHRLLLYEGTTVGAVRIAGGSAPEPLTIGRSLSLQVTSRPKVDGTAEYDIAYDVDQRDDWRFRCPVWLPTVPTRPGPGRVHLDVTIPDAASPAGSQFPLLDWTGSRGRTVMGDVPAFVRAPYSAPGLDLGWWERLDSGRATDAFALVLLVGATAAWAAWRRR